VAVIDVETFTERDMDPGTAGVQALGAEQSFPRTPLPSRLDRVVVDPRGDLLYCATLGAVLRVDLSSPPNSARQVTTLVDKIGAHEEIVALAVSAAGETLYVGTPDQVVEYDAAALRPIRSWMTSGLVDLALR
jgi:hypothetical protein